MDYYEDNAAEFIIATRDLDMKFLYDPFLENVPQGGRILDAGCGCGRDVLAFANMGYKVIGFDKSEKLSEYATAYSGVMIDKCTFMGFDYPIPFDAIWANASLLHVPKSEIDETIQHLTRMLKVNGTFFMSFKVGESEGCRRGRFFNDYTTDTFTEMIDLHHKDLIITKLWETEDMRYPGSMWLNVILTKV